MRRSCLRCAPLLRMVGSSARTLSHQRQKTQAHSSGHITSIEAALWPVHRRISAPTTHTEHLEVQTLPCHTGLRQSSQTDRSHPPQAYVHRQGASQISHLQDMALLRSQAERSKNKRHVLVRVATKRRHNTIANRGHIHSLAQAPLA